MNHEETPPHLVSVPNSLRTQIDKATNLLAQSADAERRGDSEIAIIKARQGLQVVASIAERSPELGAMLLAPQYGYTGFTVEHFEHVDRYEVMDHKVLGLTLSRSIVNVPFTRRTQTNYRFTQ